MGISEPFASPKEAVVERVTTAGRVKKKILNRVQIPFKSRSGMFRKGCRVKSNSQLKGSDRKKLKSEILSQFASISEEDINLLMPTKTPVSSIKVLTNSGEAVIVYSAQKLPLIFEIGKVMYPTVYMLWELPNLLHSFTTNELVSQKIMEGADLMVPGVMEESFINQENLKRGEKVSINISTNKASIAVGKAAMGISEIISSGNRGKCVQVLHTYGDKLWSLERTINLPRLGPVIKQEDNGLKVVSEIYKQLKETSMEEQAKETMSEINSNPHLPSTEVLPCESDSMQGIPEDISERSTSSMDDLLMFSFLKSLLTSVKNVSMPLLANILYKVHILEACPDGMVLDIKETKYKKLSNFLNEMAEWKVITLESATKGVLSVSFVDYNHIKLKEFIFNHPEIKQFNKVDARKQDVLQGLEISEKFTVTAAVLPLFSKFMYKKGDAVTTQDARKIITQYVRGENLQNPECKQEVILDNLLCSIMCIRDNRVTWENLVKIIISKMGQCYQVGLPSNQRISAKGKLPLIDLQVATRSGSKKVTLVNNLELYGVNLQEFSRECQHGVAASTTINTIPGAKSAQVQIQGNQILFVSKLLTEQYRIPKRYIRGMDDLTKKK